MTITGSCNFCAIIVGCCKNCPALIEVDGKGKCAIYENRNDDPAIYNGQKIWANQCSKFPSADDFKSADVPAGCGYSYEETYTPDDDEKLNTFPA